MPDLIEIWTDGACEPNPGECGCATILIQGSRQLRIATYLPYGTNNSAELTAILNGLEALKRTDIPVRVYTDSQYAINVLTGKWCASSNLELVTHIKQKMAGLEIDFKWVKAHSGIKYNEMADTMAVNALRTRKSSREYIS